MRFNRHGLQHSDDDVSWVKIREYVDHPPQREEGGGDVSRSALPSLTKHVKFTVEIP